MGLIATIACRNNSSRLYGKPLQLLKDKTVLDFLVSSLLERSEIDGVVLAISEEPGNEAFIQYANEKGLPYVQGNDRDVLGRLIKACEKVNGGSVFRITSECPFPYLEGLEEAYKEFRNNGLDYVTFSDLPDGSNYELIKLSALQESHRDGEDKHRSELCTLYINENLDKFKMKVLAPEEGVKRPNYRITIDYPEDLILCRKIIEKLGDDSRYRPLKEVIEILDNDEGLRGLVENIVDLDYVKPYY